MSQVVRKLSQTVEAPLVIDTTEAEVLEVALEAAPGRVIVNAVNMENGRQRLDAMLPLVRDYGAATIALTIDEHGMARTADRKVEIARKIHDIATGEFGLRPDALIFDALTFTLATGDAESANTAVETLEGIRRIKAELPGVLTSLGVSNVSYGFKPAARWVLNSVFLYHSVQAGLDMAIVNPKQVTPYADIPAGAARAGRGPAVQPAAGRRRALHRVLRGREAAPGGRRRSDRRACLPAERLRWRILHRQPEGCEADVDAVVAEGVREITGIANFPMQPGYTYPNADTSQVAVRVLNQVLLPAMKEVGEKFGCGELILPFVLQSAEAMKRAVTHLERYLEKAEGDGEGPRGAGHRLRRRARHRQEPDQDDPRQQRLRGARPRQAGAGERRRGPGGRAEGRRHRPVGAARVHLAADAARRARARPARPGDPGARRRRRHQPRVRPRHHVHRRPPVRGRRALLPRRVRGARDGGPPREPRRAARTARRRAPGGAGAPDPGGRRRGDDRALGGGDARGRRADAAVLGRPHRRLPAARRGVRAPERDAAVQDVVGRRRVAGPRRRRADGQGARAGEARVEGRCAPISSSDWPA